MANSTKEMGETAPTKNPRTGDDRRCEPLMPLAYSPVGGVLDARKQRSDKDERDTTELGSAPKEPRKGATQESQTRGEDHGNEEAMGGSAAQ